MEVEIGNGKTVDGIFVFQFRSFDEGKIEKNFGSIGPRDHLKPKIGLLFIMYGLMVTSTGLECYNAKNFL